MKSAFKTAKNSKFAQAEGGSRLAFIRPAKPAVALILAQQALKTNDERLIGGDSMDELAGPYTFVGWVSADGKSALDEDGNVVDKPAAGDSIVEASAISKVGSS